MYCDDIREVCLANIGQPCNGYFDCPTGTICAGVCITSTTGELGDYCLCIVGYSCDTTTRRLFAAGQSCDNDKECITNICAPAKTGDKPICLLGRNDGYSCKNNYDCHNHNCSLGFCQSKGVVTGSVGATCSNQALCNEGYACTHKPNKQQGTCTHPTSHLGGPYETSADCYAPLDCTRLWIVSVVTVSLILLLLTEELLVSMVYYTIPLRISV